MYLQYLMIKMLKSVFREIILPFKIWVNIGFCVNADLQLIIDIY